MARYVALFRGINVGKAKRIAMADLRELLEGLGHGDVSTLLNSGNALFSAPAAPVDKLAARIHAAVARQLGVDRDPQHLDHGRRRGRVGAACGKQ